MTTLHNKVALVTGAGSGIGRSIACYFAKSSAQVCVADIDSDTAKATAQRINSRGGRAIPVTMDVCDEKSVSTGIENLIQQYQKIDIVVSNAGIQTISKIEDLTLSQWKKMLSVHLDGAFLVTKYAIKNMYQQPEGGKIIYMGSVHSHEASLYKAPYITAKHGLLGLAKAVAKEGGEKNVHSHVICPGFVKTPLVEKQIPQQAKEKGISEQRVVDDIMLGQTVNKQFTTEEDIAELALFLAAYPTGVFTGQSFNASHGWGMR